MTRPILYSFRRCPYAMRARMALLVAGVMVEQREILLRAKPAEMLAVSPKGTVPVLLLPDGRVIDESLDIMHWALDQQDPDGWRHGFDAALIAANDGPFKHHLDRAKYPHRYGEDLEPHRIKAVALLKVLEEALGATAYLGGKSPLMTDFAIFPFVRQFAAIDPAWFATQGLLQLEVWLENMARHRLFEQAMQRPPCWEPGQDVLILGQFKENH